MCTNVTAKVPQRTITIAEVTALAYVCEQSLHTVLPEIPSLATVIFSGQRVQARPVRDWWQDPGGPPGQSENLEHKKTEKGSSFEDQCPGTTAGALPLPPSCPALLPTGQIIPLGQGKQRSPSAGM
jgi:hypothetical protein